MIADQHGNVAHLGERECSISAATRVLEEAPSPVVGGEIRARMGEAAVMAATVARYQNAGTVEFIFSEGDSTSWRSTRGSGSEPRSPRE